MTIEEKKKALIDAINTAWEDGVEQLYLPWNATFPDWKLNESEEDPNVFILGRNILKNGVMFYLAGCHDTYSGWFWIEYEPEKDIVGIYTKDRPIKEKFKEDLKTLFEKHAPFNMSVTYTEDSRPVIFRKEKVMPEDFLEFFGAFKKAYDEYYPLFYMFTVSAEEWYDGFYIGYQGF